ncbi:hypothetical protein WJX73_010871 [Symbiochloris irregularis]|uniref:Uncharacterized protein n=1 Tax=Symbiochloris irregularis TaxID=706552 RepID=A0AAW1NX65_9CHLO
MQPSVTAELRSGRTPVPSFTSICSAVTLSSSRVPGRHSFSTKSLNRSTGASQLQPRQAGAVRLPRRAHYIHAAASDAASSSSASSQTDSLLPVFKYLLFAGALATVLAPQQTSEIIFGITPLPYCALLLQLTDCFLALGAVCFHNLQDAATKDHLKSDTYQRLSLTLLTWHTAVGALFLANQGLTPPGWGVALCGLTMIVTTWSTYTRVGLYGIKLLLTSPQGQQNVEAILLQPTHGAFPRFLVQRLGLHLLLAAAVSFNVKDAVERDRLTASTFQNFVKALAALAVFASVQLYRLSSLALTSTTSSQYITLYRGLQVTLGAVAALSAASIQSKKA